jgi:hypothetical protein
MSTLPPDLHAPLALGALLSAAGLVRPAQLQAALSQQRSSGEKLGDTLVQMAAVDAKDAAAALVVQRQLRTQLALESGQAVHALPDCLRVGELLVARGDVARDLLAKALLLQPPGKLLGDVLVHMGAISAATLHRVLPLQKRLLSAVLCAGLGFAFAFGSSATQAGQGSGTTASLTFSATIAKRLHFLIRGQPGSFTVEPQDLARGYLDVPQKLVFEVETNSLDGIALEFHGMDSGADIQAIQVSGGESPFRMPASGGIMLQTEGWHPQLTRYFHLSYRLLLGPAARVGTYAWPLHLSVSAL